MAGWSLVAGGAQAVAVDLSSQAFVPLPAPATIYKSVAFTTVAATNIWTPAAGKKFRLMRYKIKITANALQAVAGIITVTFNDAAGALGISEDFFVPGAAGAVLAEDDTPWIDLGNGVLSAVANNILNVTLNTALTGGNFRLLTAGTEE